MDRLEYLEARGWKVVNKWGDVQNPDYKELSWSPIVSQGYAHKMQMAIDIEKLGGYEELIRLTEPKGGYVR